MYKYPYGDYQQLNLDWIISKIKELEAGGSGGAADLEAVANALVTLSFNINTQYRRYDYCFLNGKLYRCLSDTSGVFDPSAWQEALIGDDLAVLTRWINVIDAAAVVDVKFDTSGTNGKLQQKYHDQYHDVVEVDYTPVQNSKRPLSSNAGFELNGAISDVIKVSTNNTQSSDNKLWIDESADNQIQVPTWAEFQALETGMSDYSYGSIAKGINIADGTLDQTLCYKIGNVICVGGRIHSMTNQIANGDFFRIPSGFWPYVQVRCMGFAYITEQSQLLPVIATISSNNGYVNFSISNSLHVGQVAFFATYPILY